MCNPGLFKIAGESLVILIRVMSFEILAQIDELYFNLHEQMFELIAPLHGVLDQCDLETFNIIKASENFVDLFNSLHHFADIASSVWVVILEIHVI